MQNKYVADVGDFGKYGLLRYLSGKTACDDLEWLRMGVVWYWHHDEPHNGAGKFTSYLARTPKDDKQEYRDCDSDLWEKLRDLMLNNDRCTRCIERTGILPEDTLYCDAQLSYFPRMSPAVRKTTRGHWLDTALAATKDAGLVFVDPDNGISGDALMFTAKGPKNVYMGDLNRFWERGQSLVVYHHMGIMENVCDAARQKARTVRDGLAGAEPIPLLYRKGAVRAFYVIPQPCHKELITARVCRMLDSPWGKNKHFEWVGG